MLSEPGQRARNHMVAERQPGLWPVLLPVVIHACLGYTMQFNAQVREKHQRNTETKANVGVSSRQHRALADLRGRSTNARAFPASSRRPASIHKGRGPKRFLRATPGGKRTPKKAGGRVCASSHTHRPGPTLSRWCACGVLDVPASSSSCTLCVFPGSAAPGRSTNPN